MEAIAPRIAARDERLLIDPNREEMMPDKICTLPDCGRKLRTRGMCRAHYERFLRFGDPFAQPLLTEKGTPLKYYNETASVYEGDECLFWPYSRNGCGYATLHGRGIVSRMTCELANGPPTPKQEAAHSCGNGHLGCVTKKHLSWKTRTENQADRVEHGTHNRGEKNSKAKLSSQDVLNIVGMDGKASCYQIAKQFGVHTASIAAIMRGDNWGWLTGRKRGDRLNG